ncbi:MAG TPA: hypothetical protein VGK99_10680 [Acidobacteriota bacterium]|jgi:hypothetical protein
MRDGTVRQLLLLILLSTILVNSRLVAQTKDVDLLVELATRIVWMSGSETPRLIPGQLGEDVAKSLDLPPGSRIIGTLVNSFSTTSFVDVPLPLDETQKFLSETLKLHGWHSRARESEQAMGQMSRRVLKTRAIPWMCRRILMVLR